MIVIPDGYKSALNLMDTEIAIKMVKDTFERGLAETLCLTRVSAPLFLLKNTGLNDDLNGVERPVAFHAKALKDDEIEIVQSLAKWKRDALQRYGFLPHTGLYTDMNAIRRDEELDNLHSLYVDQWDWEMVIEKKDRTMDYFHATVRKIYSLVKAVEEMVLDRYPELGEALLPDDIYFISAQELEDRYPDLTPRQREEAVVKLYRAVCVTQIGDLLKSGRRHDGRAPDYDDWQLNGDIIVYHAPLDSALEISSMGIRVDEKSLVAQLEKSGHIERLQLPFHQHVLNKELPYSIGGGIGQSRLCMFYLRKAHIGEVQASLWDEETWQAGARKLCLL